jgi:hypothetical protein
MLYWLVIMGLWIPFGEACVCTKLKSHNLVTQLSISQCTNSSIDLRIKDNYCEGGALSRLFAVGFQTVT